MKAIFLTTVLILLEIGQNSRAVAAEEATVVVSLRQYQLRGPSYIHLYLYDLKGTLKKILTPEAGLNDRNPVFSYDGQTVVFDREVVDQAQSAEPASTS